MTGFLRAAAALTLIFGALRGSPHAAAAVAKVPTLAWRVAAIVHRPQLRHTQFGVEFYDLDAHRAIYSLNAEKFFLAASTTKLLTEGTTLALLGGDFRFTTKVYRTGPISADGTLHGDVVLVASGDPNLSNRIAPDGTLTFQNEDHSYDGTPDTKAVAGDPLAVLQDIARQIAAKGITRVAGRVLVDTSLFKGGFAELGTGAFVSPIVVNDNIVDVTLVPGHAIGDPVAMTISPETSYARFINKAVTARRGSERTIDLASDTTDAAGGHIVTVSGSLPAGGPSILYAYDVPSPQRFAQDGLTVALRQAGVAVEAAPTDSAAGGTTDTSRRDADVIALHTSPPLREDVKITLKVSDNLHADTMPYLWAVYAAHAKRNWERVAFDLERGFMRAGGLDTTRVVQNDGLGGEAFIQPVFMVRYLEYVRTRPFFTDFYRGLPVLGVDGTLFNIQTRSPAAGKVRAKTGTWGGGDRLNDRGIVTAKGLAGYMTTLDGRHLAFCIYLNNMAAAHGQNGGHIAGEILGELATAGYLYKP